MKRNDVVVNPFLKVNLFNREKYTKRILGSLAFD